MRIVFEDARWAARLAAGIGRGLKRAGNPVALARLQADVAMALGHDDWWALARECGPGKSSGTLDKAMVAESLRTRLETRGIPGDVAVRACKQALGLLPRTTEPTAPLSLPPPVTTRHRSPIFFLMDDFQFLRFTPPTVPGP